MKKILLFLSFLLMSIGMWGTDVTDVLTSSDFVATSTTYIDFSNVSKSSDAKYAGQSAKDGSGNIQLRSKNSNSGVVSTTSGGTVKSVKITVGSGSNTVDIYGSNTAYTSASDLYGSNKGTKIGSVTSTGTITFAENYTYVGIRSNNGAIYLSSIEITWNTNVTFNEVIFKNNGVNYDTIYTTEFLDRVPAPPLKTLRCCSNSYVFVGWSEFDVDKSNNAPSDLFQNVKNAPSITTNKTFNAVFAYEKLGGSRDVSFVLTIDENDFNGKSYEANNNEKLSVAVSSDDEYPNDTVHIKWASNQVMQHDGMQWHKNDGCIYNNTPLGTITSFNIIQTKGTYEVYGGSTKQPSSGTPIGNPYFKITNTSSNAGYTSKITIEFTKSITPKTYSNYTTYCIDTLQSGGNWSESSKWKHERVPEFNEAAVLLDSAIVNIPRAVAKYVIIDKSSTNTGRLTIGANQGLEVQDTISVYDGTYRATTPNDLILESSDVGNASLIFNNNNESQATVCLYSIASIDRTVTPNQWNWQYIGTPMTSVNALYNYYGSWLYEWVKNDGWTVVPNGGTMYPWRGYCITQETNERYNPTGTLIPTDDIEDLTLTVPVHKDMVFANSWTAPIHISKMEESGFVMNPANVYLFNTGSAPNGSVAGTEAGTHIVIPVHAAPYLKDTLIAPQQGFFVTNKDGESDGSIVLNYKKLVRGSDSIVAGPMHAPRRSPLYSEKPVVLRIYANASLYRDNVTILAREDFSTGFDNGWDGDKSSFGTLSPSIYVVNNDGSYDAVSAIPDYEGTLLGFRPGTDIAYSLTFEYDGDEALYLNDMLTQESTMIDNESRYVFTSDGSEEVRFVISTTPYSGIATDIDKLTEQSNTTHKFLYNGNLYILKNNCIFNIVGSLIQR